MKLLAIKKTIKIKTGDGANRTQKIMEQNQQNQALLKIDYVNEKFAFTKEERALIKELVAKDLSEMEFKLFIIECQKRGLDPFLKEIYALKFNSKTEGSNNSNKFFTVISAHKLFEIIAKEQSFAGFSKAEFEWGEDKKYPISCTKSIRQSKEGRVLDIYTVTLFFNECAGKKTDGNLNTMWEAKPTRMLEKCVDAHLCRRFPITQNYSINGMYIEDEVRDAEYTDVTPKDPKFRVKKIDEKAPEIPANKENEEPPTIPAPPPPPATPPPPPPATPPTTPPTQTKKDEFDMNDLFDNC